MYVNILFILNSSNSQLVTNKDFMVPDVSYGANSVLVQASTAIDLRCNESQGRFLIVSVISVVVVRWCNKYINVLFVCTETSRFMFPWYCDYCLC